MSERSPWTAAPFSPDQIKSLRRIAREARNTYVGRNWPSMRDMRRDGIGYGLSENRARERFIRRYLDTFQPEFMLDLLDRFAARSSPAPAGLDAAWAEAEAALPKAGWMHEDGRYVIADGRWSITVVHVQSGDGYYEPVEEGFKAFATVEPGLTARGDLEPDPAAALRALAARLAPPSPADPAPREPA